MSFFKDDMGPHCWHQDLPCVELPLPETCCDAGGGSSFQLHPQASVLVCCFRLLVFVGFFFNLLDLVYFLMWFVFLTVCSPLWWCCLKCLFRGHGICLGLTSLKSQRLSCS